MMNKLGFAIKLASQGARNAIECNKHLWVNKVVDIREYLKLFGGLQGTDNVVSFLSFDEDGCFLTLLRSISGKGGDFLSGWIYIPNTIEITGQEVVKAYDYVRYILSKSNLADMTEDIESFFSREYPKKEFPANYVPSGGSQFAVRYIGYYSLEEILGEDCYQTYYDDYKAIFLLNKNDGVSLNRDLDDLTQKELEKSAVIIPPSPEELQQLGRGVRIRKGDGSDFDKQTRVKFGSMVSYRLSRFGFEDITDTFQNTVRKQTIKIDVANIKWRKKITRSMFTVVNSNGDIIEDGVHVYVNDCILDNCDCILTEENCKRAKIKVVASNYDKFEEQRDLLRDNLPIVLRRKINSKRFTVELANGYTAQMTLESKYLSSNDDSVLLTGYDYEVTESGDKILCVSSSFVWKQRILGFLAAIIFVLLVWGVRELRELWIYRNNEAQTAQYVPQEKVDVDNNNEFDLDHARKYLNEHNVWDKSEMDNYSDLKGLYDDMNHFNLNDIVGSKYEKLKQSSAFTRVLNAAQNNLDHQWNPKQGVHTPTYNPTDDERINLTNYCNWLDQDQTPKENKSGKSARQTPTSGTGGGGSINNTSTNGGL